MWNSQTMNYENYTLFLSQRILGNFKTKNKLILLLIITYIFMESVIKTESFLCPRPNTCCQEIIYISLTYLIDSFHSKKRIFFSIFPDSATGTLILLPLPWLYIRCMCFNYSHNLFIVSTTWTSLAIACLCTYLFSSWINASVFIYLYICLCFLTLA